MARELLGLRASFCKQTRHRLSQGASVRVCVWVDWRGKRAGKRNTHSEGLTNLLLTVGVLHLTRHHCEELGEVDSAVAWN